MHDSIDQALAADVSASAEAVRHLAVEEVQRQASDLVAWPNPEGSPDDNTQRQIAWQLACLRIELAVGLEPIEEVVLLRRAGATWAAIGMAAGTTRQAAHERWGARVLEVLNRYGEGELGGPVADDDPLFHRR